MLQQYKAIRYSSLDLSKLKTSTIYKKSNCAWFFSKKDPFWEYSNMAGGFPIILKSGRWHSSEQLYQASKYSPDIECIPQSAKTTRGRIPNVRERIFNSTNPRGSKMTQKCAVKNDLVRKDWDDKHEIRIHSMLWVLELKLYNHPRAFGQVLLNSGDKAIVEKSNKDSFWGCKEHNHELLGCNVLGKLLTILRDEKFEDVKKGIFTYPNGFLL